MIPCYDPSSLLDQPQPCKVCGRPTEPDDRIEISFIQSDPSVGTGLRPYIVITEYICGACAVYSADKSEEML